MLYFFSRPSHPPHFQCPANTTNSQVQTPGRPPIAASTPVHPTAQRRRFIEQHVNDTALLDDIFGKQAARLSDPTEHARLRTLELDAVSASSVAIVVSEAERFALLEV